MRKLYSKKLTYDIIFLKKCEPNKIWKYLVFLIIKKYSTDKSYSFINGVLAKVVKDSNDIKVEEQENYGYTLFGDSIEEYNALIQRLESII